MVSGGDIPSSSFERGYSPYTQNMLHMVVREMGNGVTRLEWWGHELRPDYFPGDTEPIDPREPDFFWLFHEVARRAGLTSALDAVLVGCRYVDESGLVHLCGWSCINPHALHVAPVQVAA